MIERKLPRAVQKQKDEMDARIAAAVEAEATPTDQPPAEQPPAAPAPVATEVPAAPEAPEDFEHKYKVLQGMYGTDIKALKAEVDSLKSQNLRPALIEPVAPLLPPAPEPYVTQEDVDAFGDDTIDMTRRIAEGVAAEQMAPMLKQQTEIQANNFDAVLTSLAPTWNALNRADEFIEWLGEKVPYTNLTRHDFLNDAYNRQDAQTVSRVFNDYQAIIDANQPPPPPTAEQVLIPGSPPLHESPQTIPPQDLGAQIVPPQVPVTPAPLATNDQTFTATQVKNHFTEVSRKQNRGPLSRSLKERDEAINLAISKGLVVPG